MRTERFLQLRKCNDVVSGYDIAVVRQRVAGILNIAEYSTNCAIFPDLDRQTLLFSRFGSDYFLFALFGSIRFLLSPIRI